MDKNNKVLLSIFLAVCILVGGAAALVLDTFIRLPDFTQLRTKVIVPIKLADKTWIDREMGPRTAHWVPNSQISKPIARAVIASEDTSFFSHQGIDFHELQESLKKDWEEKRWVRGGSTLTQQVVKNVYLSREKSLWRKFKELVWAREIEKVLRKTEILTFYLNMAEFGPSIYGIKEAAAHYFDVTPSQISPKQAAFLAMLLPSPIKFHSYFVKKELTPFAKARVAKILRIMHRMGDLNDEEYQNALSEKLWGVAGELSGEQIQEPDANDEDDPGIVLDVLQEPMTTQGKPAEKKKTQEEIGNSQSSTEDPQSPTINDVLKEPQETTEKAEP